MADGIAKELIKSDKRNIFPLFAFGWLTLAMFEIKTSYGSVSVVTDDHDMPVYIGLVMVLTWLIMLYKPPPERRRSNSRDISLSHVTRNLAERVSGFISHKNKNDWMLFTDAAKLKTDHHDLGEERKHQTLNGLQLDISVGVGVLERSVLESGESILRRKE